MKERVAKPPRTTANGDAWIRRTVVMAVGLVSFIASYVSYSHGWELAHKYGESNNRAWAYPLTIDGLILSASMVILRASRHGLSTPWAAWTALCIGISGTLFANVAHGVPYGPIGMLVSGWPAVALVLSFEMLMRLLRPAKVQVQPRAQVQTPPTAPVPAQGAPAPAAKPDTVQVQAAPTAPAPAGPRVHLVKPVPVSAGVPASDARERRELGTRMYRDSIAAGEPMSQVKLAQALGMTSRKLAAKIIKEVNEGAADAVSQAQAAG